MNLSIPDDVQDWLDKLEQAVGELVTLRSLVDAMKAEDPAFVERHARKVAEDLGLPTPTRKDRNVKP